MVRDQESQNLCNFVSEDVAKILANHSCMIITICGLFQPTYNPASRELQLPATTVEEACDIVASCFVYGTVGAKDETVEHLKDFLVKICN